MCKNNIEQSSFLSFFQMTKIDVAFISLLVSEIKSLSMSDLWELDEKSEELWRGKFFANHDDVND